MLTSFIDIVQHCGDIAQFGCSERFLSQFDFPDLNGSDTSLSNLLSLGQHGNIQFFIRTIQPFSEQSTSAHVLGIKMDMPSAWIVRVVALSGRKRIDIKAGSTRADILRVPMSRERGTWSDLFPIDRSTWNPSDIFLIEFI